MSIFRLIKYSSILYFLGKHRNKLYRSVAVLLFAFVSSLIYDDLRVYLAQQHPGTLIYALIGKIVIVYGSLVFVLLQFRSGVKSDADGEARAAALAEKSGSKAGKKAEKKTERKEQSAPNDRLQALTDLGQHDRLRSRYDRVLEGSARPDQERSSSSTKSSRS